MISDDFIGTDGHFEIWARLPPDAMVVRGQIIGKFEDPSTASHRIPRAQLSKAYGTTLADPPFSLVKPFPAGIDIGTLSTNTVLEDFFFENS